VAGVAVGSRNTRFQATRYGLTWAGLAPADRASFLGAFLNPGYTRCQHEARINQRAAPPGSALRAVRAQVLARPMINSATCGVG